MRGVGGDWARVEERGAREGTGDRSRGPRKPVPEVAGLYGNQKLGEGKENSGAREV